jgi:acyl carrier protein phosphodiesterase
LFISKYHYSLNFLAHCFLSCRDDHLLMGNLLGDLVKIKEVRELSSAIRAGVELHRIIDSFTDSHAEVRKGKKLLYPHYRKYAPVVLDIFFDYLLARNWAQYSGESLDQFTSRTYSTILTRLEWVPDRLHPRLEGMVAGRFLNEYTTWEGLDNTFARMRRFVGYPELLEDPIPALQKHEEALNAVFVVFFPDLLNRVEKHCAC